MPERLIETSLGRFRVDRPSLGGWKRVLMSLPQQDYDSIVDTLLSLASRKDENLSQEDLSKAIRRLIEMSPRLLSTVALFARECLYAEGRDLAIEEAEAESLTDADLDVVLTVLQESGILDDLRARTKKWIGGLVRQRMSPAGAPASTGIS